jgi:hypothetical protein
MLDYAGVAGGPSLQLPADLLRSRVFRIGNRRPRVLKKIMIGIGIIIVWEHRDSIVPVSESVITYVIATGSSLLQSV